MTIFNTLLLFLSVLVLQTDNTSKNLDNNSRYEMRINQDLDVEVTDFDYKYISNQHPETKNIQFFTRSIIPEKKGSRQENKNNTEKNINCEYSRDSDDKSPQLVPNCFKLPIIKTSDCYTTDNHGNVNTSQNLFRGKIVQINNDLANILPCITRNKVIIEEAKDNNRSHMRGRNMIEYKGTYQDVFTTKSPDNLNNKTRNLDTTLIDRKYDKYFHFKQSHSFISNHNKSIKKQEKTKYQDMNTNNRVPYIAYRKELVPLRLSVTNIGIDQEVKIEIDNQKDILKFSEATGTPWISKSMLQQSPRFELKQISTHTKEKKKWI